MINEYCFVKKLGEGSYGKVKLAKKKDTEEKFAIKILKKSMLKKKREFIRDAEGFYYFSIFLVFCKERKFFH
jgi:[calcium/calmodulin-dependent protein kinase] kinase